MFRLLSLMFLMSLTGQVFAQSASETSIASPNDSTFIQEQSAICASYARVMEYSGLFEEQQGELWRERRFFSGALLRSSIADTAGIEPSNTDLDSIINEYSGWMLDLFTANNVISDKEKLNERDKLRDYISNFCTTIFKKADQAIKKVRPDLFAESKIQDITNRDNPDTQDPKTQTAQIELTNTASSEQNQRIDRLLQENIKLQQELDEANTLVKEKDKALSVSAQVLAEARKREIQNNKNKPPSHQTPKQSERLNLTSKETLSPPPKKPPLPLHITAKHDEIITPAPTIPLAEIGLSQIQLASYSTIRNANNGLNLLSKELPDHFKKVELSVLAAQLSSGKNIFRVVSNPISIATAKDLCSHYWSQQYACIIRMAPSS